MTNALKSGWLSTGPQAAEFEMEFASRVSASHAVALNSCTAGMHLALLALGIGPGDEVIVPTMTFCASANVVVHAGARPVLVDVGETLNIDVDAARAAVTPRTKAILPVHYAGQPCDLEEIYEVAAENDLVVIEDAAHAVGAKYRGLDIGSDQLSASFPDLRRVTAFSFYATKNITTGEGGMVSLSSADLAERVRLLALHGMSLSAWNRYNAGGSWRYDVPVPGFKYNMSDIQAAIGREQLKKLSKLQQQRSQIAERYDHAFADLEGVSLPARDPQSLHAFHLYVLRIHSEQQIERDGFILGMRERNIGTSVHFPPVHLHSFYRQEYGYNAGDLPVAEQASEQIVSLPLFACMSSEDTEDVITAVRALVKPDGRG